MNRRVAENKSKLDTLFNRVGGLGADPELQSYWAQFLCVRTSGFVEDAIRSLFLAYAETRSSQSITNFVSHNLDFFQNPKSEKIIELARTFDPEFEPQLRKYVVDKRKDALDSIVSIKNLVAHGRSVSVTYSTISNYYTAALEVIGFVEQLLQ